MASCSLIWYVFLIKEAWVVKIPVISDSVVIELYKWEHTHALNMQLECVCMHACSGVAAHIECMVLLYTEVHACLYLIVGHLQLKYTNDSIATLTELLYALIFLLL